MDASEAGWRSTQSSTNGKQPYCQEHLGCVMRNWRPLYTYVLSHFQMKDSWEKQLWSYPSAKSNPPILVESTGYNPLQNQFCPYHQTTTTTWWLPTSLLPIQRISILLDCCTRFLRCQQNPNNTLTLRTQTCSTFTSPGFPFFVKISGCWQCTVPSAFSFDFSYSSQHCYNLTFLAVRFFETNCSWYPILGLFLGALCWITLM